MLPESLPAAVSLATGVYAAACVPLVLVVDDPVWPTRRELIESRAGDRLLVEITRLRTAQVCDRARLAVVAWLLLIATYRHIVSAPKKGALR